MKHQDYSSNRKGERQYLKSKLGQDMMNKLDLFFESTVQVPRIRQGKKQTIETLVNEEAVLLAQYLRNEKQTWIPRIANLN